jgi:hypothetical protein
MVSAPLGLLPGTVGGLDGGGDGTHHPFAEAGGADGERDVEPSAQVFQRDVVGELDELCLVEVLA